VGLSIRQRGFSLIGLLMSVAIVCILTVMFFNMSGSLTYSGSGNGNVNALGLDLTKQGLRQLQMAEISYYSTHNSYATYGELVQSGMIPRNFTNRALGAGTPIALHYDVDIEVFDNGFKITATPNHEAGAGPDSPILTIDLSGFVEEVRP
jgi:type II secretory pathway pseudopilin PulG